MTFGELSQKVSSIDEVHKFMVRRLAEVEVDGEYAKHAATVALIVAFTSLLLAIFK